MSAQCRAGRCSHGQALLLVGLGKERDEEQIQSMPPLLVSGVLVGRWKSDKSQGSEAEAESGCSGPKLEISKLRVCVFFPDQSMWLV